MLAGVARMVAQGRCGAAVRVAAGRHPGHHDIDARRGHWKPPLQFGLKSLIDPVAYPAEQQRYRRELVDDRLLAEFLDRKELPDGSC